MIASRKLRGADMQGTAQCHMSPNGLTGAKLFGRTIFPCILAAPNAFQQKASSIKHNDPHFEFKLVAVVFRDTYSTHTLVKAEPVFGCGRYPLLLGPAGCSASAAVGCKLRSALLTSWAGHVSSVAPAAFAPAHDSGMNNGCGQFGIRA